MRRVAFAALFALALSAGVAHADGWDAAMARAAAAKEKALDGDDPTAWQGVLDLFLEADAIRPTKESKYEIGFAAAKVKADDLAVESYEDALALGLSGPALDKAKEFVAARATTMARLDVRGPAGAQVFVAGRRRGSLPLAHPIVAFPGAVRVRVLSSGKNVERDLELAPAKSQILDVTAEFAPPAPPPPVVPTPTPTPPPRDVPPRNDTLGWTLVGTGAFVTVASGVLYLVSVQTVTARRDSLRDVCLTYDPDDGDVCLSARNAQERDWAQQDANLIHTFKPLRVVGAIGVGVGLVTIGLGAWQLRSKPETTATLTPTIAREGGSVTFRLTF